MWVVGSLFALVVATAMGQVASSYPTAGGIYHWASILGGRGFGWAAAWFNLLGLMFVVSSVNWGLYNLFRDLFLAQVIGMDVTNWIPNGEFSTGWWVQTIFITAVTATQALLNHRFLRLTTVLTDFSGYLIFATTIVLTLALLAFAPSLNFGRLFTFTNFTGETGGNVWPQATVMIYVLGLGLLHAVYTITGFDASAHTSEETRNAQVEVPRGMIRSVWWSGLFGYAMVCAMVLALPDQTDAATNTVTDGVAAGAKQGWNSFNWLMSVSAMPFVLKALIIVGIVVSNFLCALAGLTSCSRMMYAFSRDGGLPFSEVLRKVDPVLRTPGAAIWVGGILAIVATLYGGAFLVLSTGCAVFLYLSYLLPIAAAMRAEMAGNWTNKGPFNLGGASIPVAVLAVIGCAVLIFVGVQPPQEKVGYLIVTMLVALAAFWFTMEGNRPIGALFGVITVAIIYYFSASIVITAVAVVIVAVLLVALHNRRFNGPPIGDEIKRRQAAIAAAEKELAATT
jgi:amino acid transporter